MADDENKADRGMLQTGMVQAASNARNEETIQLLKIRRGFSAVEGFSE